MNENTIRKIGFGFRPEETFPSNLTNWIEEQLSLDGGFAGVKKANKSSPIETWPNNFKLSLKEIYRRSFEYNKLYDYYTQKASNYSMQELLSIRRKWLHENEVFWRDETRFFHSAIYGKEQIRQRLIHFWANHFTVGGGAHERKFISHHIENAIGGNLKGKFEDLLFDAIRSPGMIHYLDNNTNIGENSHLARIEKNKIATKRSQIGLNDNLAREILELHTVTPNYNYTETDIRNVAKILAGWGFDIGYRGSIPFNMNYNMLFDNNKKEIGVKKVFGINFKRGKDDLRDLAVYLSDQIETKRHLSHKLCQHFITDNPSSEEVKSVLKVWIDTKGDLPSIHRKVLHLASKSKKPKFQWPLTWLMQIMRVSGASLIDGWEEVQPDSNRANFLSHASFISTELGQGFWLRRQPNGYSQEKKDWISPAHFERRIRFSKLIHDFGGIVVPIEDLLSRFSFSLEQKQKILSMNNPSKKFIMFACSENFMEV